MKSEVLNKEIEAEICHVCFTGMESEWPSDVWQVKIGKDSIDYHTGIGHRTLQKRFPGCAQHCLRITYRDKNKQNKDILKYTNARTPEIDDVLFSLVMDSHAAEMTFAEWCGEFGYDTDSRKALATYEACQNTYHVLRRAGIDVEEAREAFADY